MNIKRIEENKKDYMDILLLADSDEARVEKYLEEGELFVLFESGDPITVAVVVELKNNGCELKNIATCKEYQRQGYGKYILRFICEHYSNKYDVMYVGLDNCSEIIGFYEKCEFVNSHITDKVYLKKKLDAEIDVKKVVDLALEAGRILLKNGGEIFRVEETIERICKRFHVENVNIFTLSHALFVSAEQGEQGAYTRVKQVPLSSFHLGIVAEVNDLSREIAAGHVSIDDAFAKLKEIDTIPEKPKRFQVVAAGTTGGAFALLLGSTITESLMAFCIGCMLHVWVLIAKKWNISKILINIIGGVLMMAMALGVVNASFLESLSLEGMIVGAIMPLVPGVAFVNAIRDIANSDFLSGTVRMIDSLLVFVYIAIGAGVTLAAYGSLIGGTLL